MSQKKKHKKPAFFNWLNTFFFFFSRGRDSMIFWNFNPKSCIEYFLHAYVDALFHMTYFARLTVLESISYYNKQISQFQNTLFQYQYLRNMLSMQSFALPMVVIFHSAMVCTGLHVPSLQSSSSAQTQYLVTFEYHTLIP